MMHHKVRHDAPMPIGLWTFYAFYRHDEPYGPSRRTTVKSRKWQSPQLLQTIYTRCVVTHHIVRHDALCIKARNWLSPQPLWTTYTRCVVTHHIVRHDALYIFCQFCTILLCIHPSSRTRTFVCPCTYSFTVDL